MFRYGLGSSRKLSEYLKYAGLEYDEEVTSFSTHHSRCKYFFNWGDVHVAGISPSKKLNLNEIGWMDKRTKQMKEVIDMRITHGLIDNGRNSPIPPQDRKYEGQEPRVPNVRLANKVNGNGVIHHEA